ncbi:MAG: DUF5104 domain-containing protein, partial [Clostridiales bacterium]|nr:DUF5104 domain-containing protein [Clostridiales bacterium]
MKKLFLIAITLIMCVGMSACTPVGNILSKFENSSDKYITPDKQADNLTLQIFECFLDKDSEELKSLFSKNIQDSYEHDTEIQEAFNYIDGNIISYDKPDGEIQGESRRGEKGVTELIFGGKIRNIETDKGKVYSISFTSYAINKDDENNVGVLSIGVIDSELQKKSDSVSDYK